MAEQILTKQKLIDADEDLGDLEEVLNGPPGKLVKTRLGRQVYTLASVPQINTMTREEVTAAVTPKANKADVDVALSNLSTTANKFYPTLAEANYYITQMPVNQVVTIGEEANAGLWHKATAGATTLTKSAYDPLTQAKVDATTKANAAYDQTLVTHNAEKTGNLLKASMFVAGNLKSDGIVESSSSISYTQEFIPFNEFSRYKLETSAGLSTASGAGICFYNKDKVFISGMVINTIPIGSQITVPSNTRYMRMSALNANTSTVRISVETNPDLRELINTKSVAAESNAKTYADGLKSEVLADPLLATKVFASNDSVEKLVGVIAGSQYVSAEISLSTITTTDKNKHSYLVGVKPNTTYTIAVSIALSNVDLRNFTNKPDVQSRNLANSGSILALSYFSANQRYATFTTDANTNFIVIDPKNYTNFEFVISEGVYAATIWNSFSKKIFDKTLTANILNVKRIISEDFSESRNLFESYTFGLNISDTREENTEYAFLTLSNDNPNTATFKKNVGAYIAVSQNTTYTLSKEISDQCVVALMKSDRTTGKIILRDNSTQEFTFTTAADTAFVFVLLSRNYQQPKVQLELGLVATQYQSVGTRFKEAALPLGEKLSDKNLTAVYTDNMWIDLGQQTEKFQYKANVRTSESLLSALYDPLVADFPHLVTKNLLGKDYTGNHNIYEYVFEPDHYEQKIVISAGMHPFEAVPSYALGLLLNEAYRNPEKHEGLAYLRNKVKIVVIPIVNAWAMDTNPKGNPSHSLTPNSVNVSRNFPERWDVLRWDIAHDNKGSAPLSEPETQHLYNVLKREKDGLAFYFDLHTAQGFTEDTIIYWQEDDNFLKPVLENIVSMRNDYVRSTFGREPVNQTFETQRATQGYHPWRVWDVPVGILEYATSTSINLSSEQTTYYTNLLFNCAWYALKEKLLDKRKQAKLNEGNKQFISLYGHLTAYNDVLNQKWTYAQWQTNCYDKLGLTKSVIGAASGTYELAKYVHAPDGYKNTIVLSAGKRGLDERKSVTELGFFAYKLMTDTNPHIVALRNNTRFIFLPVLNPHGFDNNSVNNANGVQPYINFATSTQPESVALRTFIDSEAIDLFVDISSLTNAFKPTGYADCQIIHNAKADAEYNSVFAILKEKYALAINSNAANYSTALVKSQIADYINSKGIAYSNHFFAQNVLPLRTTGETSVTYVDYGYESNELAFCGEVLLNNIKEISQKLTLKKYLAI